MKIQHQDGSVTDTDKLPDASAELMEHANNLFEFCKNNKIPLFLRFIDINRKTADGKVAVSGASYISSTSDFVNILNTIDSYFYEHSGVHFIDMDLVMEVATQVDALEDSDDEDEGEDTEPSEDNTK